MKPLNSLTNIEKAKLLHELFPSEIPQLLDNILAVCDDLKANKAAYAEKWDFELMSFEMWLSLAAQAEKVIKRYQISMLKSSRIFSEQLFHSFDYTVIFVNDRVCKYAQRCRNSKFQIAVKLLFNGS